MEVILFLERHLYVFLMMPFLSGCFTSKAPQEGVFDGSVASDGFFRDGDDHHDGHVSSTDATSSPDVYWSEQPLRNTLLLAHSYRIEERSLDDPSIILDSYELPERASGNFAQQVGILVATEHGFVFRYFPRVNLKIYVFDRRSGWSQYTIPERFTGQLNPIYRDGWLYGTKLDDNGMTDGYRFHVETGRFEDYEMAMPHGLIVDGYGGTVMAVDDMSQWSYETDAEVPYFRRVTSADPDSFGLRLAYSLRWDRVSSVSMSQRDRSIAFFLGRDQTLPNGSAQDYWVRIRPNEDGHYRLVSRRRGLRSSRNVLTLPDGDLLFLSGDELAVFPSQLWRMSGDLGEAGEEELLLEGEWRRPLEIALGDPIQRIMAHSE